jgi:hypothetical protein
MLSNTLFPGGTASTVAHVYEPIVGVVESVPMTVLGISPPDKDIPARNTKSDIWSGLQIAQCQIIR